MWFATPISRTDRPRDELAIKLALALTTPGVDVRAVVQTQRTATMRTLQEYTRLKAGADRAGRPALAAGPRRDGLPGRGRGALAGPLRGEPRALHATGAGRRGRAADADERRREEARAVMTSSNCATCTAPTAPARPPCTRCAASTSTVAPGELVAVMGPSGSGKSTLLNLAGGLDRPTEGEVARRGPGASARCNRRGLAAAAPAQRRLRLPGPEPAAQPHRRGERGAAAGAGRHRRSARPGALALAALAEVGLADLADRFPDEMSGGQQQRVAIARALVGDRRLVLADEPTGALDSQTGEAVLRLLRARVDAGAAGVLVTHEARHAALGRPGGLPARRRRSSTPPARSPTPSSCWPGRRDDASLADRAADRLPGGAPGQGAHRAGRSR